MKRFFSLLLAVTILITFFGGGDNTKVVYAAGGAETVTTDAAVTINAIDYDEVNEKFTLKYTLSGRVDYVKIYINGAYEEDYDGHATAYPYSPDDHPEDKNFVFEIVPIETKTVDGEEIEVRGKSGTIEKYVPVKTAQIFDKSISVDYDLNKQYLVIEWEGSGIAYVDIYEIGPDGISKELVKNHRGESYSVTTPYEALSKHTYKVVPYNKDGVPGEEKISEEYTVENYVATVYDIDADYDSRTKNFTIKWSGINVSFADIFVNDTPVAERYIMKQDSSADNSSQAGEVSFKYVPQAGANYVIRIDPYRINEQTRQEELGESEKEGILCTGEFETPDLDDMKLKLTKTSCGATNSSKQYTGFSRPAVELAWNVEDDVVAYYEIYRATTDKKASYKYIGLVKAEGAGTVRYIDDTAVIGSNYYKIRQVQKEDEFIGQEVATALSEEAKKINITIPKPKVTAQLNKAGNVLLTMDAKSDIVSGYAIYRKVGSGSYKKYMDVTDDTYLDLDITFGKRYSYRVKSFYYDSKAKKKYYGSYTTVNIKSTVGDFKAEVRQTSGKGVRVSWDAAANAEGYEVYYKSKTSGDSYKLLKTTKDLEIDVSLSQGSSYCFLIKAYKDAEDGKTYFSNAEAEIKTGFQKPLNLRVGSTSFQWNETKTVLTRKDKLTWDRVYGADGYYVDVYDASKKKYKKIKTVSGSKNVSYTVSNKLPASSDTVTYRVRAYSDDRTAASKSLKITLKVGTVSNVKVSASGSEAKVSWKKLTGADSYKVYRSNGRNMILVGTTTKNTYNDKGLSVGVAYSYYVKAVSNKLGEGDFCNPVQCKIKPPKVADLKADSSQQGVVKLQWSPEMNVNGYIIYYKTDADKTYKKLAAISDSKWSYTHKNVKEGETYYYKVVSLKSNAGGVDAQSDGTTIKVRVNKNKK